MFRSKAFGPYLEGGSARLDYGKVRCPNSDLICREQCIWLGQELLLGSRADMEDIADAFAKIHEHREKLAASEVARRSPAAPLHH
jgi:hypothetical protein